MVKHNNILPNQHFHKAWAGGGNLLGRQLKIRCGFKQAPAKKQRRLTRKAKAAAIAPRPAAGLLRPVVHCQTIKYNSKVRAGKGFSLEELKVAGINRKEALGIGIAVDHRRTNLSEESLSANVQRLKAYKAKLIVFPRKSNQKPKSGDSKADATRSATQLQGEILPISGSSTEQEFMEVTAELKNWSAHAECRNRSADARTVGIRMKRAKAKADAAAKKKK